LRRKFAKIGTAAKSQSFRKETHLGHKGDVSKVSYKERCMWKFIVIYKWCNSL